MGAVFIEDLIVNYSTTSCFYFKIYNIQLQYNIMLFQDIIDVQCQVFAHVHPVVLPHPPLPVILVQSLPIGAITVELFGAWISARAERLVVLLM